MAWSTPPTWAVSEVVTAARMQILSDDLKYLKGQAGAIALEDRVEIPTASGTTGTGLRYTSSGTGYANMQGFNDGSNSYIFFGTNRYFDGTNWQQLNSRASGNLQLTQDAITYSTFAAASSTPVEWFRINSFGNVGIGVPTPSGRLHVSQAGEISGAGFAINSLAAVTTVRTLFAAATIARGALFIILDRNNTGGGLNSVATISAIAGLSGSFTYTNNDTITIAVTAGGGVTATRTVGTNGTHDIVALAIFL